MVALLGAKGVTVMTILAIVAPATIIGLMFGALSVCKRGKELSEDPEYLKKVQEGLFANSEKAKAIGVDGGSTFSAKLSVVIFLVIICQNNFRHSFSLTWSGKTCDIRRSL